METLSGDIHSVLSAARQLRYQPSSSFSYADHGPESQLQQQNSYYFPELLFQDDHERTPRILPTAAPSSSRSSAPTLFDYSVGQSVSSRSSVPSHYGPIRHRLPVPEASSQSTLSQSTLSQSTPLPCELHWFTGCRAQFPLSAIDRWIEHIMDHLGNHLPEYTRCWFCDRVKFDAPSTSSEDLAITFCQRMAHIASHFRDNPAGATIEAVRPDYFFLVHLRELRIISEACFLKAIRYKETPPPSVHLMDINEHDDRDDDRRRRYSGRRQDSVDTRIFIENSRRNNRRQVAYTFDQ